MSKLFKAYCVAFLVCICSTVNLMAQEKKSSIMEEKLHLTQEWDKVFPKSDWLLLSKEPYHPYASSSIPTVYRISSFS